MTDPAVVWDGPEALRPLLVPIDSVIPLPGNPRRGDVEAIARSLAEFGQRKPITLDAAGTSTAGNHTRAAALSLGWTHIAVVPTDDDEVRGQAWALADNRTADLATDDPEDLAAMLSRVRAADVALMEAASYTDRDLADVLRKIQPPPSHVVDADDVPEPRHTPQVDDVWQLGPHRLLVGDCADTLGCGAVEPGTVACVWTDPPYGVSYVGKTADALTIDNDSLDPSELREFLTLRFKHADEMLAPGGRVYVAHPAGALHRPFLEAFDDHWRVHETLVWLKDTMVLGHSDYHYRHEPLLYGYKPGTGRWGRGHQGWYGSHSETSVIEVPRPKASAEHPTMKPVGLIERCLSNSTAPDDLVLDPFAGSGSTLIAAHRLGRRAVVCELDVRYAAVILARWEDYTGGRAERL